MKTEPNFTRITGQQAPTDHMGCLPAINLTPWQRAKLLEVVVALDEAPAPDGTMISVVCFNVVKEQYQAMEKVVQTYGINLLRPPAGTPGVSRMPFKKDKP